MPADPKLVVYIKNNISKYPFSRIENKIISIGYKPLDIQFALNEIINPQPPKRTKTILVAGIITLTFLFITIPLLKFLNISPELDAKEQVVSLLNPASYKSEKGFRLLIPNSYTYLTQIKENSEDIWIFPKGKRPARKEYDNAKEKTIALNVTKKKETDANILENLRLQITSDLNKQKVKFQTKNLSLSYPAFQITISHPYTLIKTIIEGKYFVYSFSAGEDEKVFQFILQNLNDPKTLEVLEKKSQKLGRRTNTGFITKKGFFIPFPPSVDIMSVSNPYDSNTEDIYVFPKSRNFQDVVKNSDTIEEDVVYLSITPGNFTHKMDKLRYKTDYKLLLKKEGSKHSMRWVETTGAQTLRINHQRPISHVEIVVFSKEEVYRIWAKKETDLFKSLYRYLQGELKGL